MTKNIIAIFSSGYLFIRYSIVKTIPTIYRPITISIFSPLFLLPMFFFTLLSQFQIGNLHRLSYLLPHITFPIHSIRHLSDKHSKTSLSFSLPALSSHKASLEAGLLSESSHHLSFDIKMIPI